MEETEFRRRFQSHAPGADDRLQKEHGDTSSNRGAGGGQGRQGGGERFTG